MNIADSKDLGKKKMEIQYKDLQLDMGNNISIVGACKNPGVLKNNSRPSESYSANRIIDRNIYNLRIQKPEIQDIYRRFGSKEKSWFMKKTRNTDEKIPSNIINVTKSMETPLMEIKYISDTDSSFDTYLYKIENKKIKTSINRKPIEHQIFNLEMSLDTECHIVEDMSWIDEICGCFCIETINVENPEKKPVINEKIKFTDDIFDALFLKMEFRYFYPVQVRKTNGDKKDEASCFLKSNHQINSIEIKSYTTKKKFYRLLHLKPIPFLLFSPIRMIEGICEIKEKYLEGIIMDSEVCKSLELLFLFQTHTENIQKQYRYLGFVYEPPQV